MDCHHFDAGRCRSCTWLPRPYADQLAAKQRHAASLVGDARLAWSAPCPSAESGFRNKAKMVVTGTAEQPCLGILGPDGQGIDLRDCGIHEPAIVQALPVLAEFVTRAALTPYDLDTRRGELKLILVTVSPDGEFLVRLVTRSQEPVTRIRKHLPWLLAALPGLVVVSVNLQPEHKAVLEGDRELVLTETGTLTMRLGERPLLLRPQSFFQTNTAVATALYAEARDWIEQAAPASVWDLYCGVGGFAVLAAGTVADVVGIEASAEAVASARVAAPGVRFEVGDAGAWARNQQAPPDLVVVNPPRRGIGPDLAGWLNASGVRRVLYSSCNPDSLAADLALMPDLVARRGRLFDMFPQTAHAEVLVLLERD